MKSPQAAIKGKSQLDKTPKEYKEFLDYIEANPNWIDEFEIDDDQLSVLGCLLYTSPSPRDRTRSRMPSSA